MSDRLAGEAVLVTGTGGGTEGATALICGREGAPVVGCDLDPVASRATVDLVRATGGLMDAVAPVDLATEGGATASVEAAADLAGGVDVLVDNASPIRFGAVDALSYADWSSPHDRAAYGHVAFDRPISRGPSDGSWASVREPS